MHESKDAHDIDQYNSSTLCESKDVHDIDQYNESTASESKDAHQRDDDKATLQSDVGRPGYGQRAALSSEYIYFAETCVTQDGVNYSASHTTTQIILQTSALILTEAVIEFNRLIKCLGINQGGHLNL